LLFARLHANENNLARGRQPTFVPKTFLQAAGNERIAHQDVALSLKNAERRFISGEVWPTTIRSGACGEAS